MFQLVILIFWKNLMGLWSYLIVGQEVFWQSWIGPNVKKPLTSRIFISIPCKKEVYLSESHINLSIESRYSRLTCLGLWPKPFVLSCSFISIGKCTFSLERFKECTNQRGWWKAAVSSTGNFLPIQLIYIGKTSRCFPNNGIPASFFVSFTINHWSNTEKSIEFLDEIIFPYLEKVKEEKRSSKEQHLLVIMGRFKGQVNDILKKVLY